MLRIDADRYQADLTGVGDILLQAGHAGALEWTGVGTGGVEKIGHPDEAPQVCSPHPAPAALDEREVRYRPKVAQALQGALAAGARSGSLPGPPDAAPEADQDKEDHAPDRTLPEERWCHTDLYSIQ